jgi:hypothetical protein
MGLDITYYSNLKKLDCVFNADGEPIGVIDYFQAYVNPDFPGRADDIENKAVYSYDESGGFRAGSYSGYNAWREELAKLAGYPATEDVSFGIKNMRHDAGAWKVTEGPFWELIHFSDCEGVIGAAVSAKLADDFAKFQPQADAHTDEWFRDLYAQWFTAFNVASKSGAVSFH